MAQLRSSVAIRSTDPGGAVGIVAGQTTQIGVSIEVDGVAATASAATCTVIRNGSGDSVSPTCSVATAGEVTASFTAGNLTTLGASMLDTLTAFWDVTITSQGIVRLEVPMVVVDRGFRFEVLYADIKRDLSVLRLTTATPSSQSNLWPQVTRGFERLRQDIDAEGTDAQVVFLAQGAGIRELALAYAKRQILEYLIGTDNAQSQGLRFTLDRIDRELPGMWSRARATIKRTTDAYATEATRTTRPVEQPKPVGYATLYEPGGLL